MNQRIRFFLAILTACVLHAVAAPLLLKIGWQCPARLAGNALAPDGVNVSLVAIARAELTEIPAQDLQKQGSTTQTLKEALEIPAEQIETSPDEELTAVDRTQLSEIETLEHQQQEVLSLPPQKNEESSTFQKSTDSINHAKRPQKSVASSPKPHPPPSASAYSQIDSEAILINNPRPPYPAKARAEGAEGTVYINVRIDTSGKISAASIVRSSGREDLDQAAIKTVREKWLFKPARTISGLPVPCEKTIGVEFRLR